MITFININFIFIFFYQFMKKIIDMISISLSLLLNKIKKIEKKKFIK